MDAIKEISALDVHITERAHQWIIALVLNPIFLVGLVLNAIVLHVFLRLGNRRSSSHIYLSFLAIADLTYIIFMLEYTVQSWGIPRLENVSSESCAMIFFLRGVFGTWSALLLVAFSFNRLLYCQTALKLFKKVGNKMVGHGTDNAPIENTLRMVQVSVDDENSPTTPSIECLHGNSQRAPQQMHFFSCLQRISQFFTRPVSIVILCLTIAILVTLPRLFSFKLSKDHYHVSCRSSKEAGISLILHMIFHIVFQRFGSTALVLITNVGLYYKLKSFLRYLKQDLSHRPVVTVTSEGSNLMSEFALVRASIFMAIIFVLLFVPPGIHWSYIYYHDMRHNATHIDGIHDGEYQHFINMHSLIGDLEAVIATLNHVLNFVVYYFTVPYFRKQVHRLRIRCLQDIFQLVYDKLLPSSKKGSTSVDHESSNLVLIRGPCSATLSTYSTKEDTHCTSI